jgi:Ca2+-binding RTX toxin-like protein
MGWGARPTVRTWRPRGRADLHYSPPTSWRHGFHLASGGGGNDTIFATGETYDRVRGDNGYDVLFGSDGNADDFWLQYDRGTDRIVSFSAPDQDHLLVSRSEFNLTTPAGQFLNASEFVSQAGPFGQPAGVRLIYENNTGILWSDKDGPGNALPIPIASFSASSSPTASLIFVIE